MFISTLIAIYTLLVTVIVVVLPDALSFDRNLDPPSLPRRLRSGRTAKVLRALKRLRPVWVAFWRWGPALSAALLVLALGLDLWRILNNLGDLHAVAYGDVKRGKFDDLLHEATTVWFPLNFVSIGLALVFRSRRRSERELDHGGSR